MHVGINQTGSNNLTRKVENLRFFGNFDIRADLDYFALFNNDRALFQAFSRTGQD